MNRSISNFFPGQPYSYFIMRLRIYLILTFVVVKLNLSIIPSYSQDKYNTWLPVETKGIYGGTARCIAIDPFNSNKIYVGLKGGGIYKAVTQPLFWSPISTNLSNYNILALKIHPNQSNLVYAGTEDGLYRSVNEGINWEWVFLSGGQINDILIDTSNTERIYLAVGQLYGEQTPKKGFWWSDDSGTTWNHKTFFHNNQIVDVFASEIIYYPENNRPEENVSKAIYIGTSKGIWISYNGDSWPDSMHQNDLWDHPVFALAIHPKEPQYVYAGLDHGVIYSKEFGLPGDPDKWHQDCRSLRDISVTSLAIDDSAIFAGTWGEGIFRNDAKFAKDNDTTWESSAIDAKHIYKIEFDPDDHNILYAATSLGVYQSTDYGQKWNPVNEGISCAKINQFFIPDSNLQNTYFLATELGGFKTNNIDGYWQAIPGLPKHELLSFLVHPINAHFQYAGFKDFDTLYVSNDGGNSWHKKDLGESCDINTFAPVLSSSIGNPEVYVGSSSGAWSVVETNVTKIKSDLGNVISLAINENLTNDTIYAGTISNGLWRISQNGSLKEKLHDNVLKSDATINCISEGKFGNNYLLVGTNYGLRYSKNNGKSFEIPLDYFLKKPIKNFYPSTVDTIPSYASVGYEGNIRSFALLQNWEELNNGREGFADLFKNLIVHPDSLKVLYSTTEGGQIYRMQTEPKIEISPDSLDFDGQRVKQTAVKYITIHNNGEWPLTIYNCSIEPNSLKKIFEIVLADSLRIFPNKDSSIPVNFTPEDTLPYRAVGNLSSTAYNFDQSSFVIIGKGTAPFIEIEPDSLPFTADVIVDEADPGDTLSFSMKNTGDDTLDFTVKFLSKSDYYEAIPGSGQVFPDSESLIYVRFNPPLDSTYQEILQIVGKDNSFFYGDSLVYLIGKGFKGPKIEIIPDSLIFPPIRLAVPETLKFVIANVGSEGVQIDSLKVSPPFYVADTSFYLNRDDSSEIEVRFLSNSTGIFKYTLKVLSEARGDSELYLEGKCASGPIIRITPTSIDFDTVFICDTSMVELNIKNVGDSILNIDSVKYDKSLYIFIEPPNPLNIFLDTDEDTTLKVFWTPQEAMILNSKMDLVTNTSVGDTSVALSGMSVSPVFNWPDTIKFDSVRHHTSAIKKVQIPYLGGRETLNFEIRKSGTDKDNFLVEYQTFVEKDSAAHVTVIFTPIELGRHLAYLDIFSETPFFGNKHVTLSGKSIIESIIDIDPPRHNFGKIKACESASQRFIITNKGAETLIIKGFWFEPPYGDSVYTVVFSDRTIPAGEQDTMTVTFHPDTIRQYPTILHLETNEALCNHSIVLDGEGIDFVGEDTIPPTIIHNQAIFEMLKWTPIPIEATITDNLSGVASAQLHFRMGGEPNFYELKLNYITNDRFEALIPSGCITTRGVEYYIIAFDRAGNKSKAPLDYKFYTVQVYVEEPGECPIDSAGYVLTGKPYGQEKTDYHLFSIPLILKGNSQNRIVLDELGTYEKDWRLFGYENGIYFESPEISFTPGKSHWLIIKNPQKLIYTGPAISVSLADTSIFRKIPVSDQWQTIANPFNFPIPIDRLFFINDSNAILNICTYDSGWIAANSIKYFMPWEGYLIKAHAEDNLYIDSDLSRDHHVPWKQLITAPEWQIQIKAFSGSAKDTCNYIGVYPDALNEWDYNDLYEPPRMGDYVMVYFPHENWDTNPDSFTTDFRLESMQGNCWDFEVETNIKNSKIELLFEDINSVPTGFLVYLIDSNIRSAINLKEKPNYFFNSGFSKFTKKLRLVVGTEDFIADNSLSIDLIPKSFSVSQNFPNPFNEITSICYSLPGAGKVTLKIYNLLGESVDILIDGELQQAGYYNITWNGSDNNAKKLPSGIYFCYFKVDRFEQMKKMVLIR